VRTGQEPEKPITTEGLAVMELIVFAAFFALLTLFSALGWVSDSRDGADWAPTNNGVRAPARRWFAARG
jgi:hypothetical protein